MRMDLRDRIHRHRNNDEQRRAAERRRQVEMREEKFGQQAEDDEIQPRRSS